MRLTWSIKVKQIVAFAGLGMILSAAIGAFAYMGTATLLKRETEATLRANADRLAETYRAWIDTQLFQLETIASTLDIDFSENLSQRLLAEARRIGFNSIAPTDMKGILHLSGGNTADLSQREYLKKVFAEKRPVVSEPVFSAVKGEEDLLTVLFAVPILRDGELTGAL
ncbi:MAG: hypothetical protein ABIJ57_11610, partial [Pseudomonadota bacterium]